MKDAPRPDALETPPDIPTALAALKVSSRRVLLDLEAFERYLEDGDVMMTPTQFDRLSAMIGALGAAGARILTADLDRTHRDNRLTHRAQ